MAATLPPTTELPARMRVHALAKLLGVTSKLVMAELETLGSPARSVQSSVDRDVAERVRTAVAGEQPAVAAEPQPEPTPPVTAEIPLFMAPEPATAPPRRRRATRASAPTEPTSDEQTPDDGGGHAETSEEPTKPARRRRSTAKAAQESTGPDATAAPGHAATGTDVSADGSDADGAAEADGTTESAGDDEQPKRRRRGRRGRGRGRGAASDELESNPDDTDGAEPTDAGAADTADVNEATDDPATDGGDADTDPDAESGSGHRRRRRRRRSGSGNGESGGAGEANDDPPHTVVHEREPRARRSRGSGRGGSGGGGRDNDEVQGISGSTRLEAKRQRRRDGRESGRRRTPILSESEFLARREAVDRTMIVRQRGAQTQVAVLEDTVLVEHFVTSASSNAMLGNIYVGRVQNVLPSMEAAFIDVGRGRNGVLYAGEVDWDTAGLDGRARRIEQALHSGDPVLVQVSKDPVGHKGARLTTQISLPGRFLVYVPGGGSTGISRKLPDTERKRLKEILRRIVPADAGVIVRTASEGVSEEELAADVTRLQAQWETISAASEKVIGKSGFTEPVALYEEPDLLLKVVRDLFNEDFAELIVEGEDSWSTVEGYVRTVASDLLPRLSRFTPDNGSDVFAAHRVDEQLAKALDRKVTLPSGGSLVIDRTEAMTVIDVNTGKFTGAGGNLEETVTRNNIEAAEEIVRQMRVRDIGGMIVVDFIDMVLESNRDLVLRRLTECLGRDRTRHQVSEVTSLGLVQMTRKRVGAGLLEEFSTPCEHCHGSGVILQEFPVVPASGSRLDGGRSSENGRGGRARGEQADRNPDSAPVVLDPGPVERTEPLRPGPKARAAAAAVARDGDLVGSDAVGAGQVGADAAGGNVNGEAAAASDEDAAEAPPATRRRARRASRSTASTSAGAGVVVVVPDTSGGNGDGEGSVSADPVPNDAAVPEVEEPVVKAPRAPRARRAASRAAAAPDPVDAPPPPDPERVVIAADTPETVVEPTPEPPVRARRRRAAGRAAGPPVDGDAPVV